MDQTSERWLRFFAVVSVVAISAAGIAYRATPFEQFAVVGPIALFSAVIGNAATAVVLFETWRDMPKCRAAFALALSFAASAVLALLSLLTIPSAPSVAAIVRVSDQSGPWLYLFWHAAAAIGAVTYIVLLRYAQAPGRRFLLGSTVAAAVLTASCALAAFIFVDRLPRQVSGHGVLSVSGAGPVVAALLVFSTALAFRIRRPTRIDRTLAISLLALSLDLLLVLCGGRRYSVSYYASRVLMMLGSLFVLTTAIQALVATRSALSAMEATVSRMALEAAQRANRIRALWQMASDHSSAKDVRFHRMLETAARTIRPGRSMFAGLSQLDGDTVVVVATAFVASRAESESLAAMVYPGARFALTRSILGLMPCDGGTRAWNDLEPLEERGLMSYEAGFRSFIGSPVRIDDRTYFVTFASREAMTDEPYAEDDIAYVDVVASLLAGHANAQAQFEQIQFDIAHDGLTGLKNRSQFQAKVRDEIAAGRPFVLAFANLDGFRYVNERDGPEAGDDVLVAVAAALKAVDPGDAVGRMSGDEFGILIRGAADDAGAAVARYARVFAGSFSAGARGTARALAVSSSIGAVRAPFDGTTLEILVRRASVALNVAKRQGGSRTTFFDASMQAIVEETHLRHVELSGAIARDELALVYQPTYELANRTVTGAEALVRWDHPERGRLSPAEFVDFAERNGLMGALSRWVLDRVVRDITGDGITWPPGFRVYFNLGAQMLDDIAFISHLKDVLRDVPGAAAHLGIEVTESAAMENVERSMYTIELFRRWGLSIAIDDFGTGHSSLAYLKQLTVDVIKIDRSFVKGLPGDERDAALTEMLLRITDRFGFVTLAEGIETEAQAAWLLENGCRLGQGYLMARPASFEELRRRLIALPELQRGLAR
jgi:diguanylate cyclase (GGDEF)-like protein